MKVGLDFDNTLIRYDQLFYQLACEQAELPESASPTKNGVRDYLRQHDRESEWTALQGLVYGQYINQAQAAEGMLECLAAWQKAGIELVLVSHKTRYPYAGPAFDLHKAARSWIETQLWPVLTAFPLYFEISRTAKLARIQHLQVDIYIDDLPDILSDLATAVPRRWLYDPEQEQQVAEGITSFSSWQQIQASL